MATVAALGGWNESEEEQEFCEMMDKLKYFYALNLLPVPPSPRGPIYGFELVFWPRHNEVDQRIVWGAPNSDIGKARSGAFAAGLKKLPRLHQWYRGVGGGSVNGNTNPAPAASSSSAGMSGGRGQARGHGNSPTASLPQDIQGPSRLPTLREIYDSDDEDDDLPAATSSTARWPNAELAKIDEGLKNLHLSDSGRDQNKMIENPVDEDGNNQFVKDPLEPTMVLENCEDDRDDIQFEDPREASIILGNHSHNHVIRDNDGNVRFPIQRDPPIVLESWGQRRQGGWGRNMGRGGEEGQGTRKVEKRKRP